MPVIAFGTEDFPAFFTRKSGYKADHRLDTPEEIAEAMHMHHKLGTGTGLMIANPIPEEFALTPDFIDGTINDAVREADERGIGRKELTPFLLARINELSKGESLKANIALVKNNAALAARMAVVRGDQEGEGLIAKVRRPSRPPHLFCSYAAGARQPLGQQRVKNISASTSRMKTAFFSRLVTPHQSEPSCPWSAAIASRSPHCSGGRNRVPA